MTLLERIFSPRWFMPTAAFLVRAYLRLFPGLVVTGLDNVPDEGPAVVASNHVSFWDPPVVGVAIHRPLEFMGKAELFEKRFSAAVLRGLRVFPVDRERNDIGAVKEAMRRLREGRVVGIFIQGTRNAGDAAALDGAAYLSQATGAPIVPTAIWRVGSAFHVSFGPPLAPPGKGRESIRQLTVETAAGIHSLLPDNA
ncbi:MAG TPA: lysophospholipid acyltransferase family protein [Trueperaceae bacterium]|nr:lysophospholipid acyltransferase family protein [Trueperaceae bacterium]